MMPIPKFVPADLDQQIAAAKEPSPRQRWLSAGGPRSEADVEKYLVRRVKELGGEVRKVKWIGRNSAPDRLAMLPNRVCDSAIWFEVKAPGLAASFPVGAHEKAQHREHERMRKMGQRVEVVDSYERVDEVLS